MTQSVKEMKYADELAHLKAVSGFLFLRFFVPAIVSPAAFGLADLDQVEPLHSRIFTLVAKVLQVFGNLVNLSTKEVFMQQLFEDFFDKNKESVKAFILQTSEVGALLTLFQLLLSLDFNWFFILFSSAFQNSKSGPSLAMTQKIDLPRSLASLHHLIALNRSRLSTLSATYSKSCGALQSCLVEVEEAQVIHEQHLENLLLNKKIGRISISDNSF